MSEHGDDSIAAAIARVYPSLPPDAISAIEREVHRLAAKGMARIEGTVGVILGEARRRAGLTQSAVARHLRCSISKIVRTENGTVQPSWSDVQLLINLYRIDDPEVVSRLNDAVSVRSRWR